MSEIEVGPEAQAAAKWWADTLRRPPEMDNGDGFQSASGTAVSGRLPRPSLESIDRFELLLARRVQEMLDRGDSPYSMALNLSTDYGPGLALAEVAEEAGVTPNRGSMLTFPWKTAMQVKPGEVIVGAGYRAPFEAIYKDESFSD